MRTSGLCVLAGLFGSLVACDYTGDWLFAPPTDAPGVVHLGELVPTVIDGETSIDEAVIYGEIGATGTAEPGGVTFSFEGTGGPVCVWVDPELVFWNQSVAPQAGSDDARWAYPDNVFDDGDLDLYAGYAVYYSGSPGEKMGDFEIRYEDSLGNQIPLTLNECTISGLNGTGAHSGRGAPESCTLAATLPGVSYMVAIEAWSTPLDDDRLSYGLILAEGDCDDIRNGITEECVILGEARDADGEMIPDSSTFEVTYCANVEGADALVDYCETEAETYDCSVDHCFCGDPDNTPTLLE